MKFKKLSILLASVLMLSCLFTACGDKDKTDTPSTEVESTETTETKLEDTLTKEEISLEDLVKKVELCDYSSIPLDVVKEEVTEDAITKEMESYISYFTKHEQIKEGTVENGMTVNIAFKGFIDGKEFDGGSATNYDLKIGSNSFIEGFESGLVGAKVGDKVTLNLKFPEDYSQDNTDLNGKDVVFEVTVNYIQGEAIKPELTDAFISENTDYKSVEDLKKNVTEYLTNLSNSNYEVARENGVLDYLIKNSKLPKISESYITDYVKSMNDYYVAYSEMFGMEMNEFLESYMGMTEEEFKEDSRKAAINYMQSTIILKAIADKEGITLTDEEFKTYLDTFATESGYENSDELLKTLEENNEVDEMKQEALFDKVMTFLFERIKEVKATIEE